MPSLEEIQYYFSAVWRTMTGHPEALNNLNTTADGFWRSFYAILVALPALLIGWVDVASRLTSSIDDASLRFSTALKLGTIDLIIWLLPLLIIGMLSRHLGIERRYSTYVVATNWATALFAWIYAPITFLNLLIPALSPILGGIGLGLLLVTLLLSYQLTRAALQRPHSFVLPFFLTILFCSIILTLILQGVTGLHIDA